MRITGNTEFMAGRTDHREVKMDIVLEFESGGNIKLTDCWLLGTAIVGTTPSGVERLFAEAEYRSARTV